MSRDHGFWPLDQINDLTHFRIPPEFSVERRAKTAELWTLVPENQIGVPAWVYRTAFCVTCGDALNER